MVVAIRTLRLRFLPTKRCFCLGIYINAKNSQKDVGLDRPAATTSTSQLPITLRFTNRRMASFYKPNARHNSLITIFDCLGLLGLCLFCLHARLWATLYSIDSLASVIWANFWTNPTDTLLAGQRLVAGQMLLSSVSEIDQSIGVFKLSMQSDGNLVQYPYVGTHDAASYTSSYWAYGTNGTGPNVTLNLDSGGFLYLLQNSTIPIRNLTQGGFPRNNKIYLMKIDVDGILRLYSHDLSNLSKNGSVIWASPNNKCAGKGLCGINGYCTVMNDNARCRCLPGFDFVNPDL
ncbi:G-type lectin S-receptor-like serine/threonine-protein kinase LECRK3 [Tanacetum coccineum]